MNSPTNQSANDRSADVKPRFGLKVERSSNNDLQIEVWQLHSPATPQIKSPKRIAGLRGRNLELIENRVYKLLERDRIRLADTLLVDDYIESVGN